MPVMTKLGFKKILDPEGWRRDIVKAMTRADGSILDAAAALEVSERQLFRWLALDELKDIPRAPSGVWRERRKKHEKKKIASRQRKAS